MFTREQVAEWLINHDAHPSAWLLDQVMALLAEAIAPKPPSSDAMEAARVWLSAQNCEFGVEPRQRREAEASLAALLTAREDAVRAQERDVVIELFNLVSDIWNANTYPEMQRAFKRLAADPSLVLAPSGRMPGGIIFKRTAASASATPEGS